MKVMIQIEIESERDNSNDLEIFHYCSSVLISFVSTDTERNKEIKKNKYK